MIIDCPPESCAPTLPICISKVERRIAKDNYCTAAIAPIEFDDGPSHAAKVHSAKRPAQRRGDGRNYVQAGES